MSKIHAVRLININYNNNAIRISDECFHFQGESTLLSLRNGGGKSVLVQMMTAPFVHKRYRDAKDRPFDSYFTSSKPGFILVEWALDQGAGYVLTGLMVRRNQDAEADDAETLELISLISEYREPCLQDIHHIPVVEKGAREMVLKNFTACRQMFESWKKDSSVKFFYYDLGNAAQSRQYFDKLMEYQIHYKEWETIIKKVNLKESGLSDLFADCRDEKGLVEKWFLDAVENKLNREKSRMKEFQSLMEKYTAQYQDNESKIRRRDTIRLFREEAVSIGECAGQYAKEEEAEKEQMHLLARFIEVLSKLREGAEETKQELMNRAEALLEEIARLEYEKLSGEIHELDQKLRYHAGNRDMIGEEQEGFRREAAKTEHTLHLLAMAKQQELLDRERRGLEEIRQKLLLSQKKEADLGPERDRIGRTLYGYYTQVYGENEAKSRENEEQQKKLKEKAESEKKKLSGYEEALLKEASRKGALKSRLEAYDQMEAGYNEAFQEQLARNILGEYEPGTLAIRKRTSEKEIEECIRSRQQKRKQQEDGQEKQKRLLRRLQDLRDERLKKEMEQEQEENIRSEYNRELEVRRTVLQYLELPEGKLFLTEEILQASGRKLREAEDLWQKLEREKEALEKEHRLLTEGKTLELPEALEEELRELGLPVVYGMEWMQKNGFGEAGNRKLAKEHPFLPYALLLSRKELKRLSEHAGEVYTSFPVPIVVREELEEEQTAETGNVRTYPGVRFYMLFNDNLLNEEKLRLLVEEKERQIRKKEDAALIRKREYEEYFERQELVKHQNVTKERYEDNGRRLEELQSRQEELREQEQTARKEQKELEQEQKRLEREQRELEGRLGSLQKRQEELLKLIRAYEQYEENRRELDRCRRAVRRLEEQKALAEAGLTELSEREKTLSSEENRLEIAGMRLREKQQTYERYRQTETEGGSEDAFAADPEEIERLEARYTAITGSLSRERKELEEQESRAAGRYKDAAEDLEHLRMKYHLEPEPKAWADVSYHRKEELHQEALLEDWQRKIRRSQGLWTEEEKKIAALDQQKKDLYRRLREDCGKEEPLPGSEIQVQDHEARKKELEYQRKEIQKQEAALAERIQGYEENLTALSEYSEFPAGEPVEWEQDFSAMDRKELRNFQGILIRDYKQSTGRRQREKERLAQILNRVVRMEAFEEDFYKKPLEAMLELTDDAGQVLRQLFTTLQSYESLMEKLEVDISLVEKEKEKLAELMEDYVREVHRNLDRIDANSTITIRERPVKMLKIILPSWEDNESLYRLHLRDFLDEVTKKGLQILERNENVQEYFGTRLTTRNLYDTVIGIGNVQIRLYKIEEQREYPITWAEVARNSGGEGFLSAFVILSSLLHYMRRDETDIFADRNEGKVLLMDNPFAQTNASHLLKPLMDMAKKTNTQLICLTGLGGESIYNRFDNIYVLNLVAASLRGGMQYLRADHVRGSDPETMVVSQIQVVEQEELVF